MEDLLVVIEARGPQDVRGPTLAPSSPNILVAGNRNDHEEIGL
jgi:hypothetical protein